MIKISIVVPIHNSQAFLRKCVDSLLAQTLEEIEILLIDDASTDSSPEVITSYQQQFPEKIRTLFLKENIRQGGARNHGIAMARGEYIAFVDSDDYIEPDMCRVLYDSAQGSDLVGADYYIDSADDQKTVTLPYRTATVFTDTLKRDYSYQCGLFVSRIYRRVFLLENQIRFPEKIFYEDAYFNFMTALYASSIVKVPHAFYHYYQSPDSTVRTRNQLRLYDRPEIPGVIMQACRERNIYDRFKELIDYKFISMHMNNIYHICLRQFDEPESCRLAQIRQSIQKYCPDYSHNSLYQQSSLHLRCYLGLTMLSPGLTLWLYRHGIDSWIEMYDIVISKVLRRKPL